MKKIKSVKLLKDLPGCKAGHIIEANHPISYAFGFDYPSYMIRNNPDFFEIEYEQERKYIDVRIEYYDDKLPGAFPTNYFSGFSDFMFRNCSHEREIKVIETGRGLL